MFLFPRITYRNRSIAVTDCLLSFDIYRKQIRPRQPFAVQKRVEIRVTTTTTTTTIDRRYYRNAENTTAVLGLSTKYERTPAIVGQQRQQQNRRSAPPTITGVPISRFREPFTVAATTRHTHTHIAETNERMFTAPPGSDHGQIPSNFGHRGELGRVTGFRVFRKITKIVRVRNTINASNFTGVFIFFAPIFGMLVVKLKETPTGKTARGYNLPPKHVRVQSHFLRTNIFIEKRKKSRRCKTKPSTFASLRSKKKKK